MAQNDGLTEEYLRGKRDGYNAAMRSIMAKLKKAQKIRCYAPVYLQAFAEVEVWLLPAVGISEPRAYAPAPSDNNLYRVTEGKEFFVLTTVEIVKTTAKLRYVVPVGSTSLKPTLIKRKDWMWYRTPESAVEGYRRKVLLPGLANSQDKLDKFDRQFYF